MIETSKEVKPEILTEQFIPDHAFVNVAAGTLQCFDGNKNYTFNTGEFCIARKNRLARYKVKGDFDYYFFCFDEAFLKEFQKKHNSKPIEFTSKDTFIKIQNTNLLPDFIHSLKPYCDSSGKIDKAFEDLKYEELLILLLQNQPGLAGIFFDFGKPDKIDLEEFMNRNYKFNVTIPQFAFLTSRSLSAFKRDFQEIFNQTPSRWLVQKRLEEAYFLIQNKKQKPSDIYLDLGFEDLSHFSFVFKKKFGLSPSQLLNN